MTNARHKPMSEDQEQIAVTDGRMPGWYWIDNAVNIDCASRIKASGIAVYTALVLLARGRSEFHEGLTTIASLAGMGSRETVIAALQRLEDNKLIAVFRKEGRSSYYRILNVGVPDPTIPRVARPSARPKPVGKTDRLSDYDQSEKPTIQPVGKTDRLDRDQSEKPTGLPRTSRKNIPNQSEFPTLHRVDHIDTHHHSNTPTIHDDDALPRMRRTLFSTWDELRARYGDDEVLTAQRVASNQARRNDLAYIAGVCARRAAQGSPRPARPEPNPAAALPRPEPEYAVAPPVALPPATPEWQRVIDFDRRLTMWGRMRGELIGGELVITCDAVAAPDAQARYGDAAIRCWKRAGNPPVETVRFVADR